MWSPWVAYLHSLPQQLFQGLSDKGVMFAGSLDLQTFVMIAAHAKIRASTISDYLTFSLSSSHGLPGLLVFPP